MKQNAAALITPEQRRQQYALEQRARQEIMTSERITRGEVTRIAYDRLYQEAPWHPDLTATRATRMARTRRQATLLKRHVARARRVLEIGCGSGDLIRYLAARFPSVAFTGVDISATKLTHGDEQTPSHLQFLSGDCVEPMGIGTGYDLVISSQLLEHFHPDDAPAHLRAVRLLLRPGGTFELDTPNRYTGPHDVSAFFTREATGTHLKEWTFAELHRALKAAGFWRVRTDTPVLAHLRRIAAIPGDAVLMPIGIKVALESLLGRLPRGKLRRGAFRAARMDNIVIYAQVAK
jgi:SAM-dependent methyltransferase